MLGIAVDRFVLAKNSVEHAGRFLVIYLSLFSEVDAANPLVLDLLERRLDLHYDCQLVEEVPEGLELAVDIGVLGSLTDVAETLDLAMCFLQFLPLLALPVHLPLLLGSLGIGLLRRHCITPKNIYQMVRKRKK